MTMSIKNRFLSVAFGGVILALTQHAFGDSVHAVGEITFEQADAAMVGTIVMEGKAAQSLYDFLTVEALTVERDGISWDVKVGPRLSCMRTADSHFAGGEVYHYRCAMMVAVNGEAAGVGTDPIIGVGQGG